MAKRNYTKPIGGYRGRAPDDGAPYMPTEDEIAMAAAGIRDGWSEAEWESRLVYGHQSPVECEPVTVACQSNNSFLVPDR